MGKQHGPIKPAGWVIDRDYIENGEDSQVGKCRTIAKCGSKAVKAVGERFRMIDGDGIPYYGGWISEPDRHVDYCPWQSALGWGMAYAGCASIECKGPDGKWTPVM